MSRDAHSDPPGPIDNSDVLQLHRATATHSVITNSDYGWISMDTWLFFCGIYGGGPAHNICCSAAVATAAGAGDTRDDDGGNAVGGGAPPIEDGSRCSDGDTATVAT